MTFPFIEYIPKLPESSTIYSFVGGAVLTQLFNVGRKRIKTLKYTVNHERVALAANDAVFGNVQVTWQGSAVTNLYMSTITLENTTSADLTDLIVLTRTPDHTLLLNQSTRLGDQSFVFRFTDSFAEAIRVGADNTVRPAQETIYRHGREFLVPVLNRGQKAIFTFLTMVPNPTAQISTPVVLLELLHSGVRVKYHPSLPEILGVPVKTALPVGFVICVLLLIGVLIGSPSAFWISLVCMIAGLAAQLLGAYAVRFSKFIWAIAFS